MKFYKIFMFNENKGTKGNSINMNLPESIYKKTLQCLKAKTDLENELDTMLLEFEDTQRSSRKLDSVRFQMSEKYKSRNKQKESSRWEQVLSKRPTNRWKQVRNRLKERSTYESSGSDSLESR